MAFRLNRYHRNYLFWIYPLIFAGLTFYAIRKDKLDRESGSKAYSNASMDSSEDRNAKPFLPDNLRPFEPIDSAIIFFVTR